LLLASACGPGTTATATTPPADLPANVAPSSQAEGGEPGLPAVGDSAPDFSYTDAGGSTHKLSDLRGRVVVLNFWATWCVPCRQEMPALDRVAKEYGDSVVVLGVNKLEQAEQVASFAREIGVGFTLVVNPAGDIPDRYGIRALPTTYVIRPDGTIGQWRPGALDFSTFAADIQAAQ
jgi:thiol-disulfide isomerase/thioredoxin